MTSTRGAAPGLATPHPLGPMLPALYHDDSFAQRFTSGLDEVLAPALAVLDCLDAYVDPALAPEDFLAWLGSWLGVVADENVPLEQRRALVETASDAYRWHGTARGIAEAVRAVTGAEPRITDTGGVSWSSSPADSPPAYRPPQVLVVVPSSAAVETGVIERAVAEAKPAHVAHRVEVEVTG